MSAITYVIGDATKPQGDGPKILCHICNDDGGWGKGFVIAISKRWKQPEAMYRQWFRGRNENGFALGAVQFIQVEGDLWIANMIGQHKRGITKAGPPIRYDAVATCLDHVAAKALELGASLHMPRIGCGLAGGEWSVIEKLLSEHCVRAGLSITVYDFVT